MTANEQKRPRPSASPYAADGEPPGDCPSPGLAAAVLGSLRLRADDPSELLSLIRCTLGIPLTDALVLLGCTRTAVIGSAVLDLGSSGQGTALTIADIERALVSLAEAGASRIEACVVVGDGVRRTCPCRRPRADQAITAPAVRPGTGPWEPYRECAIDPLPDPACGHGDACDAVALAVQIAAHVALLAHEDGADDPLLDVVWMAADGLARPFVARPAKDEPGAFDLGLGALRELTPLSDTVIAAQLVALGRALPPDLLPITAPTRALLRTSSSPGAPAPLPRPPIETTWRHLRRAVEDSLRQPDDLDLPMTLCERVRTFVRDLADERRCESFADLVLRPEVPVTGVGIDRSLRLDPPPELAPHPSIAPGGSWFTALAAAVEIARPANPDPDPLLERGWCSAASCLALIAVWSGGVPLARRLCREVLDLEPEHPMARWALVRAALEERRHLQQRAV